MEGLITPTATGQQKELFGRRFVVVDLDGTLCDSAHREHLAVAKQWDEFHSLLGEDRPHQDVADLLEVLNTGILTADLEVILLTGRNERYRGQTEAWLLKNRIKSDHLLMRPDYNFISDHLLKPSMLYAFLAGTSIDEWAEPVDDDQAKIEYERAKQQVWFILEDRDKVVEAWRNMGLRCWQTQPGGY